MSTAYSEQSMVLACRFTLIESALQSANKPHTFFQLLKNFLETIKSQDPTQFHYDIARYALHIIDKEVVKNEEAIDLLARELLKACDRLDRQLKMPTSFAKLIKYDQRRPNDPYLLIIELPKALIALEELFFGSVQLAIWDIEYLTLLSSIGSTGKVQSTEILKQFLNMATKWNARFWFQEHDLENGARFFHTPAFYCLAAVLWEDIVKKAVKSA